MADRDCFAHRAGPSGAALLELSGHAHTVWRARFNPFHDQLLLSCSSDATVGLWYTPSVAAAAGMSGAGAGPASPVPGGKPPGDGRVKSFTDHEESVYGACRGCCSYSGVQRERAAFVHQCGLCCYGFGLGLECRLD